MHFKGIPMLGGANSTFVGYTTLVLSPSIVECLETDLQLASFKQKTSFLACVCILKILNVHVVQSTLAVGQP